MKGNRKNRIMKSVLSLILVLSMCLPTGATLCTNPETVPGTAAQEPIAVIPPVDTPSQPAGDTTAAPSDNAVTTISETPAGGTPEGNADAGDAAEPPAAPEPPAGDTAPQTPANPSGEGTTPEAPAAPGDGTTPQTPATPGDGTTPETPVNPGDGTTPETPATPGDGTTTPETEDIPDSDTPTANTPTGGTETPAEPEKTCTCTPGEDGAHVEGCPLYQAPAEPEKTCTCTPNPDGTHLEGCPLYQAPAEPEKTCTCAPNPDGTVTHMEGCPLYVPPVDPFAELYEKLMQTSSSDEVYALTQGLSEEEYKAFVGSLTEEQLASLQAHMQEMESSTPPQTVVFTQAGPFLPAVEVGMVRRALRRAAVGRAAENLVDNPGLITTKNAQKNEDGSYTIKIESYATGTVTIGSKATPVDIVLVLDQSGSMKYGFDGEDVRWESDSRQYAMKEKVKEFIGKVAEKYDAETLDHRMAIVTFNDNARRVQDWTNVDSNGKNTLQRKINGLNNPNDATNVAAGMQEAETLMGSGYSYNGSNTKRQKVVIVFTDGVPTTGTAFNVDVADNAISSAKRLKDSGVTVYSIGIFEGANPSQMHGDDYYSYQGERYPCNGSVGSYWGSYWGERSVYDTPAGNRFLNLLSSNFPGADESGITEKRINDDQWWSDQVGWKIRKNFDREASDYYLSADSSDSLDAVFDSITQNIQTPSVSLGSEAVLIDKVTPYFTAPIAGTVTVKTAAKTADGWAAPVAEEGITATPNGKHVTVTGFDYSGNFVSDTAKEDGTYGKKLILEFRVNPENLFLGGNDVPTNTTDSGIYNGEGAAVETFPVPKVNVPIKDITVIAPDKNVYLLGDLRAADIKKDITAKAGNVPLDLNDEHYGLEEWQYEYVNISGTVTISDGKPLTDQNDLKSDVIYTAEVKIEPITDGTASQEKGGAPATEQKGDDKGSINVFKPVLTYEDKTVYYGESAPILKDQKVDPTLWKHSDTLDTAVEMIGEKPTLEITYTPAQDTIVNGKIAVKEGDIRVQATVMIGTENVTDSTVFGHVSCAADVGCQWQEGSKGDPAFLLHVKNCKITITKNLRSFNKDMGDNATFLFEVKNNTTGAVYYRMLNFTEAGEDSTIIDGLPFGNYTVKELDTAGYNVAEGTHTVPINKDSTEGEASFTNSSEPDGPHGDSASVKNMLHYEDGKGWVAVNSSANTDLT